MLQHNYVDLIDRLINKELRFEALAAHEQFEFLEAARERSLVGDYADICQENDCLNNILRQKRSEIKELEDKNLLLIRKIREVKDYCYTWRSESNYTKAQLFEKLRKVENILNWLGR